MAEAAPPRNPWLYGPAPDLLFGCGLLYVLLFALLIAAGPAIRSAQPGVLFPLFTLIFGAPHYGATLLRVYERSSDRRSYAIFSVWATAAVAAAFVVGVFEPLTGSLLATLYLTWSPWHYTGQNYGIAVLFLRRRGIAVVGTDKRLLYASFLLSYLLVFLVMHAAGGNAADIPVVTDRESIRFLPLGLPPSLSAVAVPIVAVAYLSCLLAAVVRLARKGALSDLAPALLLAGTQVLWFSLPFALRFLKIHPPIELLDWDHRTHYFTWIAAGHSIQYLWVTSYTARQSGGWRGHLPWYAKVLAAGSAIWMLPALIFGPVGIGALSMDHGLALMIAAGVNLHHFILDGAIWKLRGRIADVLIRSRAADAGQEDPSPGRVRRAAVWALCGFGLFLYGFDVVQKDLFVRAAARDDLEAAARAQDRLAWFGLEHAAGRLALGGAYASEGKDELAEAQLRAGLAMAPTPAAAASLAELYEKRGDWAGAAGVYEEASARHPQVVGLLVHASRAWVLAARPDRALPHLERAHELKPGDPGLEAELSEVRAYARDHARRAPAED